MRLEPRIGDASSISSEPNGNGWSLAAAGNTTGETTGKAVLTNTAPTSQWAIRHVTQTIVVSEPQHARIKRNRTIARTDLGRIATAGVKPHLRMTLQP
jgi:hypothetical protein